MPVCAMPAYFFAHSAMDGRGNFAGRDMMAGRMRGRTGFFSVSVAVFMVANCAALSSFGKGEAGVAGLSAAGAFFTSLWSWPWGYQSRCGLITTSPGMRENSRALNVMTP